MSDEKPKKTNRSDINILDIAEKILDYARKNSESSNYIDVKKATKALEISKGIFYEAYTVGPIELKQYTVLPQSSSDRVMVSSKLTVTIPKSYIVKFNKANAENKFSANDFLDVKIEDGKIVLSKR